MVLGRVLRRRNINHHFDVKVVHVFRITPRLLWQNQLIIIVLARTFDEVELMICVLHLASRIEIQHYFLATEMQRLFIDSVNIDFKFKFEDKCYKLVGHEVLDRCAILALVHTVEVTAWLV